MPTRRIAPRLALGLLLLCLSLPASAVSIDESESQLAGSDVADLSGAGELGFALTLRGLQPVILNVVVDASEKASPIALQGLLSNVAQAPLSGITLALGGTGVQLAEVGHVAADAAPTGDGIVADTTSAAVPLDGSRVTYFIALQDVAGAVDEGWRIDASALPDGEPLELTITPAPEPAAALLGSVAVLLLALLRARAPKRDAMLAVVVLFVAGGARAGAVAVTTSVDGAPGSLRDVLATAAGPGDTITFQVSEVILDNPIDVPSNLAFLTLQGPVTIRPAPPFRGIFNIEANGLSIQGITFQDTQVATSFDQALVGVTIVASTFLGDAPLFFDQDVDCVLDTNIFDVDPLGNARQVISLDRTSGCSVANNDVSSPLWADLQADNDTNLTITGNNFGNGIFSRQRGGTIFDNDAEFVYVVPNDGVPSDLLVVEQNRVDFMRVHRTNVEIANNPVSAVGASQGLAGVTMSLTNGDPRGGVGSFSVHDNGVTGGDIGILYSDRDGLRVPGDLTHNDVLLSERIGILASGPQTTVIRQNTIDAVASIGGIGLWIKNARNSPVLADRNTVQFTGGNGIAVSGQEVQVELRDSTVTDSSANGIWIRGGGTAPVRIQEGSVTASGGDGVRVEPFQIVDIVGGEYANNSGAGVFVSLGSRTQITLVSMHDNGGPGIDLEPSGVTANDVFKLANDDLDWPSALRVDVPAQKLVGVTEPFAIVDVYEVEPDPRGGNPMNGEGIRFLSAVTADGLGRFVYPESGAFDCVAGTRLTLTASLDGPPPHTSEFSPDVDCNNPPLDTDGDGVPDDQDECTKAGTDPNGCNLTLTTPDGITRYCNDPTTCNESSCLDCATEDPLAGFRMDCFDVNAVCQLPGGQMLCINCALDFFSGTASIDCFGGQCIGIPGLEVLCEGLANGCVQTFENDVIPPSSCPADRGCIEVVNLEGLPAGVVIEDVFLRNVVTIEKRTIGGEGTFEFRRGVDGDTSNTVQTAGTTSTQVLQYIEFQTAQRLVPEIFVAEVVPPGWELASIECSHQGAIGMDSNEGHPGVTLPLGVRIPPTRTCTFTNRRLPVETVRAGVGGDEDVNRVADGAFVGSGGTGSGPAGPPEQNLVTLAGAGGWEVVDAITGDVATAGPFPLQFLFFPSTDRIGTLILKNPFETGHDAYFAYGNTGILSNQFNPDTNTFGLTLLGNDNVTDAFHYGGDPAGEGYYVNLQFRSVHRLRFEPPSQFNPSFLQVGETLVGSAAFPAPQLPISAYAFPNPTHVLVAIDGQPGQLVVAEVAEFPTSPATVVGALQNDPRRVRCAGTICATANFGSDTLTISTWDGATTAAITATANVGDGPVGVSLRPFGSNVLVASTGTGDDTYTITEVGPSGTVVSNTTSPAPAGCTGPGFALWLRDAAESLVITCNTSDSYAVLTPGPTP